MTMGDLRNTLRTCAFAGALALAGVSGVHAQGVFTINGRLKVEGGGLDGAKLIVLKDGQKVRTLNNGLSKFSLDLDVNANYVLEFEKDGFVTKKLSFDTHAPMEAVANGFTPFEFAVNLFKQYEGVNTVVFDQPVGMIRYDKNLDDFDYDTDYTKSIQSQLQQVMDQVVQKQEEEKGRADEEGRRKAEEEKARAKADAEKAKVEAEAAKAKAREEKAAAEAAQKEQVRLAAEQKKAEEAARKAEQERQAEEARQRRDAEKAQAAEARKPPPPKEKPAPPPPPPPPPPRKKVAPAAPPPPPPVRSASNGVRREPVTGDDLRRAQAAREGSEHTPVRTAEAREVVEARPPEEVKERKVVRNEELIVEPNAVITRIQLDDGVRRTEYRRVVHKRGPTFYFKDGQTCSQRVYETEALAERR